MIVLFLFSFQWNKEIECVCSLFLYNDYRCNWEYDKETSIYIYIWKGKQADRVSADWLCMRWPNSEKGKRETDSKAGVSRTTALVSLLLHKMLVFRVINKMCYISTKFIWTKISLFLLVCKHYKSC